MKRNWIIIALMLLALPTMAQNRQPQVVDKVVAVVGKNIILQSDIENQFIQYRLQGMVEGSGKEIRSRILEDLLLQKLMLNQAEMDSITVTDEQVEAELNRKIQWFISRIGSQEKMEAQFGKTMSEIKEEVRQAAKDNMLQEEVQRKIMENVVVTPNEVRAFFNDIPKDSLPTVDPEYEIVQIVKRPPVSIDEKLQVKDRLYQIRKRILEGESSFSTMAVLYSEDPGSARQGGELGFTGRGEFAAEFENSPSTFTMAKSPMWWKPNSVSTSSNSLRNATIWSTAATSCSRPRCPLRPLRRPKTNSIRWPNSSATAT